MLNFDEEHVSANSQELNEDRSLLSSKTIIAGVALTIFLLSEAISYAFNNKPSDNGPEKLSTGRNFSEITEAVTTNKNSKEYVSILSIASGIVKFGNELYLASDWNITVDSLEVETPLGRRFNLYGKKLLAIEPDGRVADLSLFADIGCTIIEFNENARDIIRGIYEHSEGFDGPGDPRFLKKVNEELGLFNKNEYNYLSTGEKVFDVKATQPNYYDYHLEIGYTPNNTIGFMVKERSILDTGEAKIIYKTCDRFVGNTIEIPLVYYLDWLVPASPKAEGLKYLDQVLTSDVFCYIDNSLLKNYLENSDITSFYATETASNTFYQVNAYEFLPSGPSNGSYPPTEEDKAPIGNIDQYELIINGEKCDFESVYLYYDEEEDLVCIHISDNKIIRIIETLNNEKHFTFDYLRDQKPLLFKTILLKMNIKPADGKTYNLTTSDIIGFINMYNKNLNKNNNFDQDIITPIHR